MSAVPAHSESEPSELSRPSFTRQIVERCLSADVSRVDDRVATVAKQCVLDWLGVALAGSSEDATRILDTEMIEGLGPATVVGRGRRVSPRTAALINGTASHALDFDDTHLSMHGHPTAAILPAVLATAEQYASPGPAVLSALIAGVEGACETGKVLADPLYEAGWHNTHTLGIIGAAIACAHILELPADRACHAVGLAATQAAGLKAMFGTMTKPLHAGLSASGGVLAGALARGGFTARPDALEADFGFADVRGLRITAAPSEGAQHEWAITQTLFKQHAACYLTHSSIENALTLMRGSGLEAEDVERASISVAPLLRGVCNIQEPQTGLEAKFSLRVATALALLGDDTADPATFSTARTLAADVVALRDRIVVSADRPERPATTASLVVQTKSGTELRALCDTGTPATDIAAQGARLEAKFTLLAGPVLGHRQADVVIGIVNRLEELSDIGELMSLIQGE